MSVRDVAEAAGVSPATVSRVLSDSDHPVSDATRAKVLEAADALDFRPNLVARGLVTARTSTLGVLVHDISDPYFGEMVRGLEDRARQDDFRVIVCSSDRDPDRELGYIETLLGHRVDSLVFAGGGIEDARYQDRVTKLLDGYRSRGGVVVALAPTSYEGAVLAFPDNQAAAADMTDYLLALGHRRIAFVAGPEGIRTSHIRLSGYEDALLRAGQRPDPQLVRHGAFTVEGGASAVQALLEDAVDLTAVFAANDLMACGALRALADAGLDVPGDVSVVGFDDIYLASCVQPALTTVHMGMYEMGRRGAELALAHLSNGEAGSVRLSTRIVERASAGPPPGSSRSPENAPDGDGDAS